MDRSGTHTSARGSGVRRARRTERFRRLAAAVASTAIVAGTVSLISVVALVVPPPTAAGAATITATFNGLACTDTSITGGTYTTSSWGWAVAPVGATSATFSITGAGGAGGDGNAPGGKGAIVGGSVPVKAGQYLWSQVGCGGLDADSWRNFTTLVAGGFNRGGAAEDVAGGGGGGSTGLCVGTATPACGGGDMVAVAAGGGGGGNVASSQGIGGNGNSGTITAALGGTINKGGNGTPQTGGTAAQGGTELGGTRGGPNFGTDVASNGASTTHNPPTVSPQSTGGTPPFEGEGGRGDDGSGGGQTGGGGGGGVGGGGGGGGQGGGGAGGSWANTTSGNSGQLSGSPSWSTASSTAGCASTALGTNAGFGGTGGGRGCHGTVTVTWNVDALAFAQAPSSEATGTWVTQPVVQATSGTAVVSGHSISLSYSGIRASDGATIGTTAVTCTTNPVSTLATGLSTFAGCNLPAGRWTLVATDTTASPNTTVSTPVVVGNTFTGAAPSPALDQGCGTSRSVAIPSSATTASIVIKGAGGGGGAATTNPTGGPGASGALVTATNVLLPRASGALVYPNLNYEVGCAGVRGTFSGSASQAGGLGGGGFGAGGDGGASNGSGASGGGGGGGTGACLGAASSTCGTGQPIAVAAGGAGGGATARASNTTNGTGGNQGSPAQLDGQRFYGSGASGSVIGGAGGASGGGTGVGGGGGWGTGAGGQSGGAAGSANTLAAGGGIAGNGNLAGTNASATFTGGGDGGKGGTSGTSSRRSGGGGGGGGYYGGGGGGGDTGSGNAGGAGGGSGSSYVNTSIGATVATLNRTGGSGGGAGGAASSAGTDGTAGSITVTFSGSAIALGTESPANRSNQAGDSVSVAPTTATIAASASPTTCCTFAAFGLPTGLSVNSTDGVVSGTPTAAGTYTVVIKATSSSSTYATVTNSFTWTISAGPATKLAFTTQPNTPVGSGTAFTTQPVVTVQDVYGNTVTGSTASILLEPYKPDGTALSPAGSLACTSNPRAAVAGVDAFAGCAITGGITTYKLRASSSGLTDALSNVVTIARGTNSPPTSSAQSGSTVQLGQTVAYVLPVGDLDGYSANSSGDEATPTVAPTAVAGGSVTCGSFVAAVDGTRTGTVTCTWVVGTSATVGAGTLFTFTVNDRVGGTTTSPFAVTGTVTKRAITSGLQCRNSGGTVVTAAATGDPSYCTVSYTDPSTTGSSAGGTVTATVTADAPSAPSAASVSIAGTLATGGADFYDPTTGALLTSSSCTLAQVGASATSACEITSPVIFRAATDGTATVAMQQPLGADAVHAAGAAASAALTVSVSCTAKIFDGKSLLAPTGGYTNDAQYDFYGYNLGCAGAGSATTFGYAYSVGTDPDLGGADAWFTDSIGTIGSDGFAQWHPQIYTDPSDSVKVRFFSRTAVQAPAEYGTLAQIDVPNVNWLSGNNVISINGVRAADPFAQTITFPAFVAVRDTSVTLAATASSTLAVTYVATGGCSVAGSTLTFSAGSGGTTCKVVASQAGNGYFSKAGALTRSIKVALTPQTLTFTHSPATSFTAEDVTPVTVTSDASPALTPTVVGTSGVCTYSDGDVTFLAAGTCSVVASQAGDATRAAAKSVTWRVKVVGKAQSIHLVAPAGPYVVDGSVELEPVTTSSGGTATLTTSSHCSVSPSGVVSFTSAGTCKVTATIGAQDPWAKASTSISLKVVGKPQVINGFSTAASTRSVGEDVDVSGATAVPSGETVTVTVSGACSPPVAGLVHLTAVGTCTITARQGGGATWAAAASLVRRVKVIA